MGEVKGFMKYARQDFTKKPVAERVKNWDEFVVPFSREDLRDQAARCMDCGVPFCHWACPIGNLIPDWNDLVYQGRWQEAYERLSRTNNFPEFTGRVCPAPCEHSCTLEINEPAVTIKNIEWQIIEQAYDKGWVKATPPRVRTGRKVAVVGSGPAGLACADQLNKKGHSVTVYEKNEVLGGLLTLGIPSYKLEKSVVERRLKRMDKEGVKFKTKICVGKDVSAQELKDSFDAVVFCGGAEQPRDLVVEGRDLKGVYFVMEYLTQQTRINLRQKVSSKERIDAKGKKVVVLGGGDSGSDCIGTAHRQGAASVKQFELLPEPPQTRSEDNPWPQWAFTRKISSSQEEGVDTEYCVMTKRLSGEKGQLKKLHAVRLEFGEKDPTTGRRPMKEIPGSSFEVECDLLLLAMGFLGPVKDGLLKQSGVNLDQRGNVKTDANYMTSQEGVFAAGDMRRGQSLVVHAINEGRCAAEGVHRWLKTL